MPTPTGTISMSDVNVELGRSSTTTISLNETVVRTLAGVASGTISMNDLRGKSSGPPSGTFSPDGGTTVGTAVYLSSDVSFEEAEIIITCTENATWNYTKTGSGGTEFVSVANGAVSSSIIFRLDTTSGIVTRTWNVTGVSGSNTRYWTVFLRTEYV
jgi:hypothetical protein